MAEKQVSYSMLLLAKNIRHEIETTFWWAIIYFWHLAARDLLRNKKTVLGLEEGQRSITHTDISEFLEEANKTNKSKLKDTLCDEFE